MDDTDSKCEARMQQRPTRAEKKPEVKTLTELL